MNRGNLPGYYYDEEKQKYFKITANHVAPVNAKYSKTNVKREEEEKRELKKRKFEDSLTRTQTVHRAVLLQNRMLSTTLPREIGHATAGQLRSSRGDAIVASLNYRQSSPLIEGFYRWPPIVDAHYAVHQQRMLLVTSYSAGTTCVYSYEWPDDLAGPQLLKEQFPLVAMPGRFVSMQHVGSTLLVVSESPLATQYFLGPSDSAESSQPDLFPSASLMKSTIAAHACAYEPHTQSIAFAGLGLLVVNGANPGHHLGRCNFDETTESFAVTWLQPSVLAYGLSTEIGQPITSHTVCLWDLRVGTRPDAASSSSRMKRRHNITGLERIGPHDHHLLVTSNNNINLYDLRMQSADGPPLLKIAHTSAGAQLNYAVQGDLIAATDELFRIKVYSLHTSRHLRTLRRNQIANSYPCGPPLGQLRWQEDQRGSPYLQACADGILHKWAY